LYRRSILNCIKVKKEYLMAGGESLNGSAANNTNSVSKLILRIEAMPGLPFDEHHSTSRLNEVARTLGEQLTGRIDVCPSNDKRGILMAITGAVDLDETLVRTTEAVDSQIQGQMLPLEVHAARMALQTHDVTPNAAWGNLNLNPAYDATEKVQEVIAAARDRAWQESCHRRPRYTYPRSPKVCT
jgi:hypothetical protein